MVDVTPQVAEPRTLVSLKLTNNNDFVIEDRFDSVPYVLKPGEPVSIPSDAALHMLGWYPGCDLKAVETYVSRRWGWNTPELIKTGDAKKFFAALSFKPITFKLVEVVEKTEAAAA